MKIKGFINKLLKLKLDDLFLFSDCFALGITRHLCPRTFVRPSVLGIELEVVYSILNNFEDMAEYNNEQK